MNVFMTNDDGVESPGLQKMAARLRGKGHRVLVIAPDRNRSGFSNAISLTGDFGVKKVAEDTYMCRGTPADCVLIIQKGGAPFVPDLFISGINAGENIGTDLLYSATAGAARQAALTSSKSLALSLAGDGPYLWDEAVAWIDEHLELLLSFCAPEIFVNVNIPNRTPIIYEGGLSMPAKRFYNDRLVMTSPDADGWQGCSFALGKIDTTHDERYDWCAIERNCVSVSKIVAQPVGKGK